MSPPPPRAGPLPLQGVRHQLRMPRREQGERHETARADQQPLAGVSAAPRGPPSHLAVSPEPDGAHRHRFHHRAKSTHAGAVGVDAGPAVDEQGVVGRRAADVGDERVAFSGEVRRADQACGGTGEDGLDRLQPGDLRADQRPVAAHHHHRRGNPQCAERAIGRVQQALDGRHETGVQHARHRPPRTVEPARERMAARHRQAGALAQAIADRKLVLRVAHREHSGHRECVDRAPEAGERPVEGGEVRCLAREPRRIVTAADTDAGVATKRIGDSGPRRGRLVEADEHQAHPTALPFDERVGGERGGERDERDRRGIDSGALQDRSGGAVDADREIMPRGQRLRGRHDPPGPLVVQHGVGIRAAGIDSEQDGHGRRGAAREKREFESKEYGADGVAACRQLPTVQSYVRRPEETGNPDRGSAENHDPQYALRPDARSPVLQSARP